MFLHLSVILLTGLGEGLCPGLSLTRGVSVWGSLSRGISVQTDSLCRGVSVQGVSVQGISVGQESVRETPYGNMRAVRILLECILVSYHFSVFMPVKQISALTYIADLINSLIYN